MIQITYKTFSLIVRKHGYFFYQQNFFLLDHVYIPNRIYVTVVKLVEGQLINCMIEHSNPHGYYFQFSAQTYFPLLGEEKFPLGVEYIFESKFPLVARIGLAARACGSGIGQSPSNSVQ